MRRRKFEREMTNHEQRRISDDSFVRVPLPTRGPIPPISRASTSTRIVVASASSRMPRTPDRRRAVMKTETDETSTAAVTADDENDETVDEDDEGGFWTA